ncbi:MAG: hypothetical protein ABSB79_07060 [Syntrophales bacterium]
MNLMDKYRAKMTNDRRQGIPLELSEDERFIFEEQTGIMEYDGGLIREEAERQSCILSRSER